MQVNNSESLGMEDLERVLHHLKANKSRDPLGNADEIFTTNVAGDNLKETILLLLNRIKDIDEFPKPLECLILNPSTKRER